MNKLDFSILLRVKGLDIVDIKKKMKEKGFEDSEIQYYLKIFLNQSIHYKGLKSKGKNKNGIKMIALALSLVLLVGVFFGFATIGLVGLFII